MLINSKISLPKRIKTKIIGKVECMHPDQFLQPLLNDFIRYMQDKFQCWYTDQSFSFELPKSIFDQKREKPIINFFQAKQVQEQLFVLPLSKEQLQQIRIQGTFNVRSVKHSQPYKWQINQFLYNGNKKNTQTFLRILGGAYSQLYQMYERIFSKNEFSLVLCLGIIYKSIKDQINLMVGLKKVNKQFVTQPRYLMEVLRHHSIYDKYKFIANFKLNNHLNTPLDLSAQLIKTHNELLVNRNQIFYSVDHKFYQIWNEIKEDLLEDLQSKYAPNQVQEKIIKSRDELYQKIFYESDIQKQLVQHYLFLRSQLKIIQDLKRDLDRTIAISSNKLDAEIRDKYFIRSHCHKWFSKLFNKSNELISKNHKDSFLKNLIRNLKTPFITQYVTYVENYQQNFVKISREQKQETPRRIFSLIKNLSKPFCIKLSNNRYSLVTTQIINIGTSQNYWKIKVFCKRYFIWCHNFIQWGIDNVVDGSFGIKVLFKTKIFYPHKYINPDTGQVGNYPYDQVKPLPLEIKESFNQVKSIRQEFQNSADDGFISKKSQRPFNILNAYFIKLILQTLLFYIILKPILIIINFIVTLILLTTTYIWMPFVLLLCYFYQIFIYDVDSVIRYGYEPLFRTMKNIVVSTFTFAIGIPLSLLITILIHPSLAMLYLLVACIRYALRTSYDFIVFQFIKLMGRSPIKDSWFAWKTNQPRIFYQAIKESDVYILLLAELQKIELQIFRSNVEKSLKELETSARIQLEKIEKKLSIPYISPSDISNSIQYYLNKLSSLINKRIKIYPNHPGNSLRFTQQQLDLYTTKSKQIILNFMQKHPEYNLFAHLGIRKKNIDKLVNVIWLRIFTSANVFEALQDENQRQNLQQRQQDQEQVNDLLSNLDREIDLKNHHNVRKFTFSNDAVKLSLIENKSVLITYSNIYNLINYAASFPYSQNDPQHSIFININVKDIYKDGKIVNRKASITQNFQSYNDEHIQMDNLQID